MAPDPIAISRILDSAGINGFALVEESLGPVCTLDAESVPDALRALVAAPAAYVMLVDLFGTDTGEEIELTWHLRSFAADEELYVRSRVPYDAEVPSVWRIYAAALYPEREAAELLGVTFVGHPNPKRLLTSDEVESYLLRKSTPLRSHADVVRPGVPPHEEAS